MKKYIIIAILAFTGILAACSDSSSPNDKVIKMTLDEVRQTPGYNWYVIEEEDFEPNANVVGAIRDEFDPDAQKILFFVSPACACAQDQSAFPKCVKTMTLAGFSENVMEIYSMNYASLAHPYDTIISVIDFPTIYILKNSEPVYSLGDSLKAFKEKFPNDEPRVEAFLLAGIRE